MRTAIATLFLFAVSAAQAKAELTVKEYKERMASSDAAVIATTRAFINGLGVGIGWANTDSKVKLFCQPGKLALEVQNFIDIINSEIETASTFMPQESLDKSFIGLVLLRGLEDTFPCASK